MAEKRPSIEFIQLDHLPSYETEKHRQFRIDADPCKLLETIEQLLLEDIRYRNQILTILRDYTRKSR